MEKTANTFHCNYIGNFPREFHWKYILKHKLVVLQTFGNLRYT